MIDTFLIQLRAGGDGGGEAANPWGDPLVLIMIALLIGLIFFTFRRGQKMRKAQQEAHTNAVVGAEVLTAGGVVGTIVARDEDRQRITLEFSNGDRVDFLLGAVQQVITPAPGNEEPGENS